METLKNSIQNILDDKNAKLNELAQEKDSLDAALSYEQQKNGQLQKTVDDCQEELQATNTKLGEVETSCDQLRENYDQLKSQSSKKMRRLIDELESLQEGLGQREARLKEVEQNLQRRDSIVKSIQQRVADALLGFKDKGLSVDIRDGKVYVSLSNKLLFKSGSTKIDAQGKEALQELAKAIKEEEEITLLVEGHTDDVPVSNLGDIKDNWDLSVMRSTEVVRILVEAGMTPEQVIPAGRGEYIPLNPDKTPQARASNRRTEIAISPNLEELYQLISQ